MSVADTNGGDESVPISQRVFELYVESLEGERDRADELLLIHLGYFGEDIAQTVQRLRENPRLIRQLVTHLSSLMQELDAAAGAAEALTTELNSTRRWALLLPTPPPVITE